MQPRVLLLAALVVAPAFAGCVTLADLADRLRAEPPLEWGPEMPMDQPSGGAEPTLAILPDGTLFIVAIAGSQERPNNVQGAAWLWRSQDGGETWETLRAPLRETPVGTPTAQGTRRSFGSSDADVATSPDGWVYYTDWWNWGGPLGAGPWSAVPNPLPVGPTSRAGNFLVERSVDGGASWSATPVSTRDATNVDRQWLVPGEGGFLGVAYNAWLDAPNLAPGNALGAPGSELRIVVSEDHGASFDGPFVVAPTGPDVGYVIARPFVPPASNNTVLFPFIESPWSANLSVPGTVKVAYSDDLGRTWEPVTVAENVTFETIWPLQGAADESGNAFLVWNERRGDAIMLMESHSTDLGRSWSAPRPIVASGLNLVPWVAARGDGRVAVAAYYSNATGGFRDVANETEWRFGLWESANALANGTFSLVYESAVVKTGPLCAEGAACPQDRELLDYAAVAYGPDGRLHGSWARTRENPQGGAPIGHVHYSGSKQATG